MILNFWAWPLGWRQRVWMLKTQPKSWATEYDGPFGSTIIPKSCFRNFQAWPPWLHIPCTIFSSSNDFLTIFFGKICFLWSRIFISKCPGFSPRSQSINKIQIDGTTKSKYHNPQINIIVVLRACHFWELGWSKSSLTFFYSPSYQILLFTTWKLLFLAETSNKWSNKGQI